MLNCSEWIHWRKFVNTTVNIQFACKYEIPWPFDQMSTFRYDQSAVLVTLRKPHVIFEPGLFDDVGRTSLEILQASPVLWEQDLWCGAVRSARASRRNLSCTFASSEVQVLHRNKQKVKHAPAAARGIWGSCSSFAVNGSFPQTQRSNITEHKFQVHGSVHRCNNLNKNAN